MDRGGSLARQIGVGYDFEAQFSPRFLSGKKKLQGAPVCTNWFMQNPSHSGLKFTEQDRHIL
jgi:hypothetical protein